MNGVEPRRLLTFRALAASAGLVLCLAATSTARAQGASDSVAARALFAEGVELSDAGSWSEAIDRFRRALELRDSAVIAFNLGVALAHENHPVEAAERFRRVVRDEEADEALRGEARAALETAEAAIAWVQTSWDGDATGAMMRVDGEERPIALLGTRLPVDPGAHEIMLVRDGNEIAIGSITVAAAERASLALTTLEVPVVAPAPVDDDVHEGEPAAAAPAPPAGDDSGLWIGLGVGAGVLVIGGAIALAVVLTPTPEQMAYSGSLGTVELGR